jgi:cytochrome c biogenesis protein CcmG, thiol:disulfide interchange protein DsbE
MPADPAAREPEAPKDGWSRRRVIVAVLSALLVGGFIALMVFGLTAGKVDTSIDSAIAKGELKESPDFTLPVLAYGAAVGKREGEMLSLSELRGRPVVLNFWASWCDPCKREAPILEGAWRAGRAQGAVVLGVDVQDLSDNAKAFIDEYGQTYPHVRDKTDDTYREYGLTGVPETFFIDRAGRVRVHWVGEINAEQVAEGLKIILTPAEK